jgi:hypothetical protein
VLAWRPVLDQNAIWNSCNRERLKVNLPGQMVVVKNAAYSKTVTSWF